MAKFATGDLKSIADRQAANIMMQIQGSILKSVGTVRNYESSLSKVAQYAKTNLNCGLKDLTTKQVHQYLTDRALEVGQKTLDMERQALQTMMHHVTHTLPKDSTLTVIPSEHSQILNSRSYTTEQVNLITQAQTDKNSLSTEIAYAAGLRAHELITLQPINEQPPSDRPALDEKFLGRDGVHYTVNGKGGLIREVLIPHALSVRLEDKRLETPLTVTDRGIHYTQHYAIGFGKNWSNSVSAASIRTLNWSTGAHGLRHTYAQERMNELQSVMSRSHALEVVSQEMGHFRPEITEVYLR
ncbi:hypothetical protein PMAL9190_03900 [Photobacterium malacitanum]|uniref:Tyr recombinase domain-containing protein n=1 Tax=Photobacterium malacitanum TaxID=2204294 RepID=A0A1Y6MT49_9GAMM|nr:site-specific integrase [Photobacterium malacitanum]SMY39099.1 hypothetical protein PMAL9190_03900 [Photobacterium malacitanum]